MSFGLAGTNAHALALGRLTVQSALGEPLRAEIDIPDINAEEAASLHATVASPNAFKAAGLEYNPAVSHLQISLQRRPDGRSYLSLRSDRAVNDPFIDVILEANWSSGRIVRDYTMLFDPNMTRQLAPVQPTAPQVLSSTLMPAPSSATPAARRTRVAPAPRPANAAGSGAAGNQVTVQRGDTAGRIAAANKPDNVSLDQMLVALLRTNPHAFIDGNVNRLRAGAVLALPDAQQVLHNEEHLVLQTSLAERYQPGDELYAIPKHVCPTSALHKQAYVIEGGKVVEMWDVTARDRFLTI